MKKEIDIGITAVDLISADNEILINSLAEVKKVLMKHNLPKLKEWERIIEGCISHISGAASESVSSLNLPNCLTTVRVTIDKIDEFLRDRVETFFGKQEY